MNTSADHPRLPTRLRRAVLLAGCGLAFGAAFANMCLVLLTGTSVSHLTGDISRLSADIVLESPSLQADFVRVLAATIGFVLGTVFSGLWIHQVRLQLSRPYGRTVVGIGLAFAIAALVAERSPEVAVTLAAFGCGVQNSIATRYRGMILRSTHLTGIVTDLGVHLGMRLRGVTVPAWKLGTGLLLTGSFVSGGITAAWISIHRHPSRSLLGLGGIYILAGIAWSAWKHRWLPWPCCIHRPPTQA